MRIRCSTYLLWLVLATSFSNLHGGGNPSTAAAATLRRTQVQTRSFSFIAAWFSNLFASLFSWLLPPPPGADSTTKRVLDALAKVPPGLFRDFRALPSDVWERMNICFEQESTPELNLFDVSEASWEGFLQLGNFGEGRDQWGSEGGFYFEDNPTPLTRDDETIPGGSTVVVFEPCNTVSSVAYYRSMIAMCERNSKTSPNWSIGPDVVQAITRGFNLLAFSSAHFHASVSTTGRIFDALTIDIIAFTAHQALAGIFPDEPVLFHLQSTSRAFTGIEAAEELSRIFLEEDPANWVDASVKLDIPDYTFSFASSGIMILYLTLPQATADPIIDTLVDLLVTSGSKRGFIREEIQPIVQDVLQRNQISPSLLDQINLFKGFIGSMLKMVCVF